MAMTPTFSPAPTAVDPVVTDRADTHLQLFSTEAYNRRNLGATQEYVAIDHHEGGRLVGTFAGVVDDDLFSSGFSAPFGGPDLVRSRETPGSVQALVDRTLSVLAARGIRRIRVKARPPSYSANETYVLHALLHRGLTVVGSELSYGIDVSGHRSPQDYRASLKSPARRALKHADAEPYDYAETGTAAEFAAAYAIIRANRRAKGNPLRLSLEYLLRLQHDLGDRIRFFVLAHAGTPVAAALLYRLRPDIELVEYWGDHHSLDRSPMNRLAAEVCGRAITEGVRLVDLGISSVHGEPNEGLIQFKQSIGATAELRLDLEGTL